ncbi:MAG: VOC family protein [Planctomycetota bacterium]
MKGPRLDHVQLRVRDLSRSLEFYRDRLGLEVAELHGPIALIGGGPSHHQLALVEDRAVRPAPSGPLLHVAFEVTTANELANVLQQLEAGKYVVNPIDHGIAWSIYTRDPDGTVIEITLDRRGAEDGEDEWPGFDRALNIERLTTASMTKEGGGDDESRRGR